MPSPSRLALVALILAAAAPAAAQSVRSVTSAGAPVVVTGTATDPQVGVATDGSLGVDAFGQLGLLFADSGPGSGIDPTAARRDHAHRFDAFVPMTDLAATGGVLGTASVNGFELAAVRLPPGASVQALIRVPGRKEIIPVKSIALGVSTVNGGSPLRVEYTGFSAATMPSGYHVAGVPTGVAFTNGAVGLVRTIHGTTTPVGSFDFILVRLRNPGPAPVDVVQLQLWCLF